MIWQGRICGLIMPRPCPTACRRRRRTRAPPGPCRADPCIRHMHGVLWACLALTSCWNGAISFQVGEPKVSTSDLTLSQGEERGPAQHQLAANGRQDQTGKRVASNSMYGHAARS